MTFGKAKAQISTEFFTTYSFAIVVIIAIVAAIYYLGVFSPQGPRSCILTDGLSCYDYGLNTKGNLFLDLGQGTGRAITVYGIGCSSNTSPAMIAITPVTIQSKQHAWITPANGIPCYGSNSTPQSFKGTIAIAFRANDLTFNQTTLGQISSPLLPVNGT